HLVLLVVGEREAEAIAIERQPLGRDLEELLGVPLEERSERPPAQQTQVVAAALGADLMNGPALMTGTYVDRGGVSGNRHCRPPRSWCVTVGPPLVLTRIHCAGAATVQPCGRLGAGGA